MEEDLKQKFNHIIEVALDIYSNDDSDISMIDALSLAIDDERMFDYESFSKYIKRYQRDFYGALYVDCSSTKELKNFNDEHSGSLEDLF